MNHPIDNIRNDAGKPLSGVLLEKRTTQEDSVGTFARFSTIFSTSFSTIFSTSCLTMHLMDYIINNYYPRFHFIDFKVCHDYIKERVK